MPARHSRWLAVCHSFTRPFFFFLISASLFSTDPDGFALGEVVTFAHAQNVLYCVASNFLEVKQLASTLLRQLPPSAVGLQVDIWTELSPTTAKNLLIYPHKNRNIYKFAKKKQPFCTRMTFRALSM